MPSSTEESHKHPCGKKLARTSFVEIAGLNAQDVSGVCFPIGEYCSFRSLFPFLSPCPSRTRDDLYCMETQAVSNSMDSLEAMTSTKRTLVQQLDFSCCSSESGVIWLLNLQMMMNGYGFFCRRKLVTIFSAPNYLPERVIPSKFLC